MITWTQAISMTYIEFLTVYRMGHWLTIDRNAKLIRQLPKHPHLVVARKIIDGYAGISQPADTT